MNSRTSYPIFTPNQVLTKDDLNNLVSYLDSQNRLTRTHLIGMGIICGMEVSSSYQELDDKKTADAKIYISAGCGITSEGYVISLDQINLTHYQSDVKVPSLLFAPSVEDASTTSSEYTVIELFSESGDRRISLHQTPDGSQRDAKKFEDFLAAQVLVVVCETQNDRNNLNLFEYNQTSEYRSFGWRFFLLGRSSVADTLLGKGYQIVEESPWKEFTTEPSPISAIIDARNHFLQEFAPRVQRFGYVEADQSVNLTKIEDYNTFQGNYYQICKNAIAAIDKAFPELYRLFSPFFSDFKPNSLEDFRNLKQNLEKRLEGIKPEAISQQTVPDDYDYIESLYALQYFYDYLSGLVAAYDELAEAAFDLMDDCTPETRRFPKFIMLGLIPRESRQQDLGYAATSAYRSHFTQPPIYNSNQVRVKQVRYLYERLVKLCETKSFCLLPFYNAPLKITPSQDQSAPLSKQAIPYYLHYPNNYKYWNYDAYRKGRSDRHPAYFHPKKDSGKEKYEFKDLSYRLDGNNFYRIEGHIGKAKDDALKQIQEYQQRYNLAFDVITLKLGSQASLQDLNISGQFYDLELDFRWMKETFQKLWSKYASKHTTEPDKNFDPKKNILLQTLKQSFFDKKSLTEIISSSQLSNPILDLARDPDNYQFLPVDANDSTNTRFQLKLRGENNIHIARYVTQTPNTEGNSLNDFKNLIIDFSGVSHDDIDKKKQGIAEEIAKGLSLGKITYGLVKNGSKEPTSYDLQLSTKYEVNLPAPDPQTGSTSRKYSIILLSDNYFTVRIEDNQAIIEKSAFLDFETLYGLLRDVPAELNENNYQISNPEVAQKLNSEKLNYVEFLGLIDAYQQRLEQLHLFHKFAQQHPGMEHLGGVPKGGTFILVYVNNGQEVDQLLAADKNDTFYKSRTSRTAAITEVAYFPPSASQELISSWNELSSELSNRKDVIIGDFCLPYRSSSEK